MQGKWKARGEGEAQEFDAVIVALPAPSAGDLLQPTAPEIAGQLKAIRYSSTVIVQFAYAHTRAPKLPAGFGVLVPRTENRRVRAITFVHEKHPQLVSKVVGVETADHPTGREIVAHARSYFKASDRVGGVGAER